MQTDMRRAFRRGVAASLPFVIVIGPFGLLFGVVATNAGMSVFEAVAFSTVVIAGAAQFAAVQLMQDGAPLLIVILTAAAINLRMAMYSASLVTHLGPARLWQRALIAYLLVDQSYVAAIAEYSRRPDETVQAKVAFYFGTVTLIMPVWLIASWAGATFGKAIPPDFALDFAVPIAFLAMVAPMLRTPAHYAAAAVSVAVTLALWWMPYSSGLLIASVAAMATGALVETWGQKA